MKAKNTQAIIAVAGAMKTTEFCLGDEEVQAVLAIAYNMRPKEIFFEDKVTRIGGLLVKAVRLASKNAETALEALIGAKVRTNPFINAVLRSELNLGLKLAAIELTDGPRDILEIQKETIKALSDQTARQIEHNPDRTWDRIAGVLDFLAAVDKQGDAERDLVHRLVTERDGIHAAKLAATIPRHFKEAKEAVLKSGSPEALAHFYRTHKNLCDRDVFQARLADAMRPDPDAMAKAILDGNKKHGYGQGMYPMHPMHHMMMFCPDMMFMGRGRY